MARFTQAEKIKMIMAAFEFCPSCQKQFLEYASGSGSDPVRFMRELLWRLWGQWPHGEGCPQLEVPAKVVQEAPRVAETSSKTAGSASLPRAVLTSSGAAQSTMGFVSDPELATIGEMIK